MNWGDDPNLTRLSTGWFNHQLNQQQLACEVHLEVTTIHAYFWQWAHITTNTYKPLVRVLKKPSPNKITPKNTTSEADLCCFALMWSDFTQWNSGVLVFFTFLQQDLFQIFSPCLWCWRKTSCDVGTSWGWIKISPCFCSEFWKCCDVSLQILGGARLCLSTAGNGGVMMREHVLWCKYIHPPKRT